MEQKMPDWESYQNVPLSITERSIYNLHRRRALADMIARAMCIEGPINTGLFKDAIRRTVNRHPVFLCRYTKEPVTRFFENFEVDSIDIRELNISQRESFLRQYSNAPMTLDTDQLLNLSLLRTGENEYIFLAKCHHIIADGISLSLLWSEILTEYRQLEEGKSYQPSPDPVNFADYIRFENRYVLSRRGERALHSWRDKLANENDAIEKASSGKMVSLCCDVLSSDIKAHLLTQIRARADAAGVSLFAYLCSSFQQVLIEKLDNHFWLNTSLSLRIKREHRRVLGPMFRLGNLLVRREETWEVKLARLSREIHHAIRTAYVADSIGPHGSVGNNLSAHFCYLINFFNVARDQEDFQEIYTGDVSKWVRLNENIKIRTINLPARITPYGIYLSLACYGEMLRANFVYNVNCFNREKIESLFERWRYLLLHG
ncbi:condensation domain-containing protein [Microbulbifer sp. VTAC004]|uniref:condensation domain-containing protein n=1 Tax=unclassified Microbulbifer TaxID=2619833 RepID=UPI00403A6E18